MTLDEFHDYWNAIIRRYIDNQNATEVPNPNTLTAVNKESADAKQKTRTTAAA